MSENLTPPKTPAVGAPPTAKVKERAGTAVMEQSIVNPLSTDDQGAAPPIEHATHAVSFWQKKWVQDILPLATSVAFHVGIVAVVIASYKTYEVVRQIVEEQIIIPDAAIFDSGEIGGIVNPGLGGDPTRAAAQDKYPDVSADSTGWSDTPSQTLNQTIAGGGSGEAVASGAIGLGAGGFGAGSGSGSGTGSGIGSGAEGGGGGLAPFGVPGGGGGIGPKAPFMGIDSNSRRVAYVCDASGSMLSKLAQLKHQIERAIDVLKPVQAFNIIFFSEGNARALDNNQLVMANSDNKRKASEFLKTIRTHQSTDPIPGLEIAFKQKPQLIYLLTDGTFPDNARVLSRLQELNADKSVKISTILFVNDGELTGNNAEVKIAQELLKRIADEHGGTFKAVSDMDLY